MDVKNAIALADSRSRAEGVIPRAERARRRRQGERSRQRAAGGKAPLVPKPTTRTDVAVAKRASAPLAADEFVGFLGPTISSMDIIGRRYMYR